MERADHVLAQRMIDRGLAADRRVDLGEQRRRHLQQGHAPLIGRRGESGQIADDTAAERNQQSRAFGAQLEQARVDIVERRPILVRFAFGDEHGLAANAAAQ